MVEDVRIVVDCPIPTMESQDPSEISRMQQTVIHVPVPPIKVEVSERVVDLGTLEFNNVGKDIGQITIVFLDMEITEVYAIKSVVNA